MRVIIAEDVGLYRDMLAQTLTGGGFDVVGVAADGGEAVAVADATRPDLALLDIRMPPAYSDEGIRAAKRIRAAHPGTGLVLLSSYGEVEYAMELAETLTHGFGYLLKESTTSARDLVDALTRVAADGVVIDPGVVASLLRRPRVASPLGQLTEREAEALGLMAEGHSNTAIARRMRITVSTVEKYVTAVFRKLTLSPDTGGGDNARVQAVLVYLRHTGRLTPGPSPDR